MNLVLHHLPLSTNIQQIEDKLEKYFEFNQLQTAEQIQTGNSPYLYFSK